MGIEICSRLALGESLLQICKSRHLPTRETVHYWLTDGKHEEFAGRFMRARELQADHYFDEVLEISDTPQVGEKRVIKPDGTVEITQADMIDHRRLRVDSRKWTVARMFPKKYAERLLQEQNGADENKGIVITGGLPEGGAPPVETEATDKPL